MGKFESEIQAIIDAARELKLKRFLIATGGNLSMRIPGSDFFAITPSNYDYMKMTQEDICVLDMDLHQRGGLRKPSVESPMHAGIYRTREDVQVVIHTHQTFASTLSIIDKPIPALFEEQVMFLGKSVEIIPYEQSGTSQLRNIVSDSINNGHNAYILANHGVLVLGPDMERAMHNVELLEKCATTYLVALCTGAKVSTIPDEVRDLILHGLQENK